MAQGNGARGRVRTWDVARPAAAWWPAGLARTRDGLYRTLQRWLAAEVAAGQLFPWIAIAFGGGIALYFTADNEPVLIAPMALALGLAIAAYGARRHAVLFPLTVGVCAIAAGFAAATAKRAAIEHPVLQAAAWNVEIAGFVETREERERSDRIVVRVQSLSGARIDEKPDRVRVAVRKGTAPAVGAFVTFKARLSPPLQPLRPGGYDFARDLYFQGIGASGFALGRIATAPPPVAPGWRLRFAAVIENLRDTIDDRIRAVLKGDTGAIASALITGKRDAISTPVNDAMYVSSLAHVLSISGYHMAVVAGVVFFVLRALLVLPPGFATRHPIKKWAAFAALITAAGYLLLSGAQVATQRSFIMIGIVLAGVIADRPALTMRTLTVAALAVLLLAPESVVHPSFQMSFAATLALIGVYTGGFAWTNATADTSRGARVALWGVREVAMLVIASLVAGAATTPYAAYHFHRLAPYGVLANLLAMPVVSAWVMPTGILGVLALPFGLDGFFWRLMGGGIEWMIAVALWVTHLPGAVGRMAAFGTGPLLLGTLGLAILCLLKTPLRFAGAALIVVASVAAIRTAQPDVFVSPDGTSVAVRQADGRLAAMKTGSDSFAIRDWLAADADAREPTDKDLASAFACDPAGCVARLADGRMVAVAKTIEAFDEDCRRAAALVTTRTGPRDCGSLVIDRDVLQRSGAVTLRSMADGFALSAARPQGSNRPWARAYRQNETADATPAATRRPRLPDATPRNEDLEAGD